MKSIRFFVISLLLILMLSDINYASTIDIGLTEAEKNFIYRHPIIKLGVDPRFVPFEFIDSDGQYKGIAADYIKLLNEKTGMKMVVVKDLTWSEAYEKAVEKQLDALPCISKTTEREKLFVFSKPYYFFQRVIVMKDNNKSIHKLEDLYGKKVAVQKDSSHHSYLKAFSSIEPSLYTSVEAALDAVSDGSETAIVCNLATSSYIIKSRGLTNLKYIKIESEERQSLYFAVRNDWPELVSIINKGLDSITEEEKIEINNRWIGIEKKVDYGPIIRIIAIIGSIIFAIILVSFYWIIKLKREVAKRILVQVALKTAKEEAELANHIKSSFLARMSHEIRTPLNAITGMAYLVKKTDVTVTQKLYLDKITQASHIMLGIINDILDFSKIEAGKVEIERISFNLDKVLQQVISIVSFKIEEQGIEFRLNKYPALPGNFWGDPTRLEQILLNVINNAVKFTMAGGVSVDVKLVSSEIDTYLIEFTIKDTGIGMPSGQVSQLFKPFDQGDSSINRRFGGTGLGLSIVKSLVDMMGGEIHVDSIEGEGSTFSILLPFEVDRLKESEEKQRSASIYFQDIRVLVLEKNPTDLHLLEEYLKAFSIAAEFAASEAKAVQLLREAVPLNLKPYDLLIVDYNTPQEGGIAYVEKLKEDSLIEVKPKFMMIVPLMREDIFEKLEEYKIDIGITKPIMPSVLYNGIIEVFEARILDTHDTTSQDNDMPVIKIDYPYHVLIVEDNKTNQFIAKSILEQAGFRVSVADHGKEGYDFFEANQQEVDLILMDLHMPILNGYEASSMIREIDTSIPILAMTADAITGVEEKCRNVGIEYYISKPFDPEKLVVTLVEVLKAQQGEIAATQAVEEISILDTADGLRRLGNNEQLYQTILTEYYHENTNVISTLAQALQSRNYEEAIQIVHKIKSSSGNIGAKELFVITSELQKVLATKDESAIYPLHKEFNDILNKLLKEIYLRLQ